jgi:hypothetical protein
MNDEMKRHEKEEAMKAASLFDEEIKTGRPDLVINRVPPTYLKIFKDLAHKDFSGDYGMALVSLLQSAEDDSKFRLLASDILTLDSRLTALEEAKETDGEEEEGIPTLDGTVWRNK